MARREVMDATDGSFGPLHESFIQLDAMGAYEAWSARRTLADHRKLWFGQNEHTCPSCSPPDRQWGRSSAYPCS